MNFVQAMIVPTMVITYSASSRSKLPAALKNFEPLSTCQV